MPAMIDFAPLLAAAQRSAAAYLEDPAASRAAFEALGLQWLGQYHAPGHQAVLSCGPGAYYLSISGTRFGDRGGELDLFADLDLAPLAAPAPWAGHVTAGAYNGLAEMWRWVESLTPGVVTVDGHSLGGWRARYTPLFLPADRVGRIYSFESPKGGDAALWASMGTVLADKLMSVVNGLDTFAVYPWGLTQWEHPDLPIIWLREQGYAAAQPAQLHDMIRPADHDIANVVQRLGKLAGSG